MSARLYVRSRGQVLGPFDHAELRSLRDRGQLCRFHEVSEDGGRWISAASLTDLFPGNSEREAEEVDFRSLRASAPAPARPLFSTPLPDARAEWFYADAAERQHGPITRAELDALWTEGAIRDRSLVWRPGMSRWEPYAVCRTRGRTQDDESAGDWTQTRAGLSLVLAGAYATPGAWGLILLAALLQGGGAGVARGFGWLIGLVALGLCLMGHGYCLSVPETIPGLRRLARSVFGLALAGLCLFLVAAVVELVSGFELSHVSLVGGWLGLLALGTNTLAFVVFLCFLRAVARARGLGTVVSALTTLLVSWLCFVGALVLFSVVLFVTVGLTGDDPSVEGRMRELEAAGTAFVLFVVVSLMLLLALYGWYLVLLRQVRGALQNEA